MKMKKIIFSIVAVAFLATGSMVNATNYEKVNTSSEEIVQSTRTVSVKRIWNKGSVWYQRGTTGIYDSDNNTLTVGKSGPMSVSDNPYYGDDDSHGRGSYRYVAGGDYYFN